VASLGDREVIEGILPSEGAVQEDELRRALATWDAGGMHYTDTFGGARWIVLAREHTRPRERWWLHALLFALTVATMTVAGAAIAGGSFEWLHPHFASLRAGLAFSLPLAAILLAHESGHYVAARHYKVNTSPPYFIPFPPAVNLLGTMGAFIRIRSPMFDRRTLFDMGVAGPLAGMVIALPVLIAGLALSREAAIPAPALAHQIIFFQGTPLFFGDSLLMEAARWIVGLSGPVLLHPLAAAGWVGMLVTTLNLLPLAQLVGGHITYAMNARAQKVGGVLVWMALLALGLRWGGWWIWAAAALIIGRGKLTHPDVMSPARPLDRRRMIVGWIAIVIFVLTFAPVPIAG
jgi:membrane-associated protease RseP (regulator of RpoE activity)